jgi:hypothetical protein
MQRTSEVDPNTLKLVHHIAGPYRGQFISMTEADAAAALAEGWAVELEAVTKPDAEPLPETTIEHHEAAKAWADEQVGIEPPAEPKSRQDSREQGRHDRREDRREDRGEDRAQRDERSQERDRDRALRDERAQQDRAQAQQDRSQDRNRAPAPRAPEHNQQHQRSRGD